MPWFDQTGPVGMGPMTGRGMGPCGTGMGWGRGMGRGMGMGRGLGRFFGWGGTPTKEDRKQYLADYLKALVEELEDVKKELESLK